MENEENDQQEELSSIKKVAVMLLDRMKEKVINEWDDQKIFKALIRFHPSCDSDYFNPNEYCNADEGMKILGLGYNRNKFFSIIKKYGIKNHKVNNVPLGYKRCEIERLGEILDENYIEDEMCIYKSAIKKIEDGKD